MFQYNFEPPSPSFAFFLTLCGFKRIENQKSIFFFSAADTPVKWLGPGGEASLLTGSRLTIPMRELLVPFIQPFTLITHPWLWAVSILEGCLEIRGRHFESYSGYTHVWRWGVFWSNGEITATKFVLGKWKLRIFCWK